MTVPSNVPGRMDRACIARAGAPPSATAPITALPAGAAEPAMLRLVRLSLVVLVLATSLTGPCAAQGMSNRAKGRRADSSSADSADPIANKDYWLNYLHGFGRLVTAPARWERKQWLTFGAIAGGTAVLFASDEEIRNWWQDDVRGNTIDDISSFAKPFGSTKYAIAASAAFYGAGLLFKSRKTQETGLLSVQALTLSALTYEGLKLLTHRHRPDESPDDAHIWDGPGTYSSHGSFPSGHATTAFTLASVLSSQYPTSPAVRITAYSIATLTALSRINNDDHWASDVLVGSALGWSIGRLVTAMSPYTVDRRISLLPMDGKGVVGLKLALHY